MVWVTAARWSTHKEGPGCPADTSRDRRGAGGGTLRRAPGLVAGVAPRCVARGSCRLVVRSVGPDGCAQPPGWRRGRSTGPTPLWVDGRCLGGRHRPAPPTSVPPPPRPGHDPVVPSGAWAPCRQGPWGRGRHVGARGLWARAHLLVRAGPPGAGAAAPHPGPGGCRGRSCPSLVVMTGLSARDAVVSASPTDKPVMAPEAGVGSRRSDIGLHRRKTSGVPHVGTRWCREAIVTVVLPGAT